MTAGQGEWSVRDIAVLGRGIYRLVRRGAREGVHDGLDEVREDVREDVRAVVRDELARHVRRVTPDTTLLPECERFLRKKMLRRIMEQTASDQDLPEVCDRLGLPLPVVTRDLKLLRESIAAKGISHLDRAAQLVVGLVAFGSIIDTVL